MPSTKPKIAVLGWGSLLPRPGSLRVTGRWRTDGPRLPIEFGRISDDKRLTLVIVPGRRLIKTYWSRLDYDDVESAVQGLADREGNTAVTNIGFLCRDGQHQARFAQYIPRLKSWLRAHSLDAVVWTDLASNFERKHGTPFSANAAIEYLETLERNDKAAAADYIRGAPKQTDTVLRRKIRRELGW